MSDNNTEARRGEVPGASRLPQGDSLCDVCRIRLALPPPYPLDVEENWGRARVCAECTRRTVQGWRWFSRFAAAGFVLFVVSLVPKYALGSVFADDLRSAAIGVFMAGGLGSLLVKGCFRIAVRGKRLR